MPNDAFHRFHLVRFNEQQDFLFVRLDKTKQQEVENAAFEIAPGGLWVGEWVANDDGEVTALVFVNAMKGKGPNRGEMVSLLNKAVSKVTRVLEHQRPDGDG